VDNFLVNLSLLDLDGRESSSLREVPFGQIREKNGERNQVFASEY